MTEIGKKTWAIPGSNIPLEHTGEEPEFTSHDSLWVLNATDDDADVQMTLYYADREPVGPYHIEVGARRVRQVRFNDLIDPEAIPLETDYAAVVEANTPVVVQLTSLDTRRAEQTHSRSLGFPGE